MDPFAEVSDLEAIWRPLNSAEKTVAEGLIEQASNQLRARIPKIDLILKADTTGLKAELAKAAVVNAVKRVMQNPEGWLSESEAYDDFKVDKRRDSALSTGGLYIFEGDLVGLLPRSRKWGMIPLRRTI
jgi:hypothetical protein